MIFDGDEAHQASERSRVEQAQAAQDARDEASIRLGEQERDEA